MQSQRKDYTLLIWEEIPEKTTLYLIPNSALSEEQLRLLKNANGKIVNCNDKWDGLDFLMIALVEEKFKSDKEYWLEYWVSWPAGAKEEDKCVLAKYKVGDRENNSKCARELARLHPEITSIVMSGFAL